MKLQLLWKHEIWWLCVIYLFFKLGPVNKLFFCVCWVKRNIVYESVHYFTSIVPKIKTSIWTFLVHHIPFSKVLSLSCCAWNKLTPWESIRNVLKWWKHTGSHTSCGHLILVQLRAMPPLTLIYRPSVHHCDLTQGHPVLGFRTRC